METTSVVRGGNFQIFSLDFRRTLYWSVTSHASFVQNGDLIQEDVLSHNLEGVDVTAVLRSLVVV